MKIEHIALNVADPVAVADWYTQHLGMRIARKLEHAPFTHFLADSAGQGVLEIYCNPADEVPDYGKMEPLLLHLAFVSENPDTDSRRLATAGAILVEALDTPDGSRLVMMRDPWGLAIQLCKRATPLI